MANIDDALAALNRYQTAMQRFDPNYTVAQGRYSPLNSMTKKQQVQHIAGQLQKNQQWANMRGYTPPAQHNPNNQFSPNRGSVVGAFGGQQGVENPAFNNVKAGGYAQGVQNRIKPTHLPNAQAMNDARSMISQLQKTAPAGQQGSQIGELFRTQVGVNYGKDQSLGGKQTDLGKHPIRALVDTARTNDPVFQQFASDISPEHQTAVYWNTQVVPQVNDVTQSLVDWATRRDIYDHSSSKARTAMGGAPSYRGLEKWVKGPMSVQNVMDTAQQMQSPEGMEATARTLLADQLKQRGIQANQLNSLMATSYDPATGQPMQPVMDMNQFQNELWQAINGGMLGYKPPAASAAAKAQTPASFETNKKASGY